MTTITLWQDESGIVSRIRADGHAGLTEAGSDIVCAAVSVLMTTCVNALESVASAKPICRIQAKRGTMDVLIADCRKHDVQIIVQTVLQGLNDIAEVYPDHVQIKLMGGTSSC